MIWKIDASLQADELSEPPQVILNDTVGIAFSHDEQYLVGTEAEGNINIWELDSLFGGEGASEPILAMPSERLRYFIFSPDDTILAAATPDQVVLWDFAALLGGETDPLLTLEIPRLQEIAFSPDGSLFYAASQDRMRAYSVPESED